MAKGSIRVVERSYPYVFGLAVGVLLWCLTVTPAPIKFDAMLTSAISVSAILLGFLGTAKAMLLTFKSAKFSWMKQRPQIWNLLIGYLRAALLSSFWVCLASLFMLGVQFDKIPLALVPYLVPLWAAAFVVSVSTFYRVVAVFFALLKSEQGSAD